MTKRLSALKKLEDGHSKKVAVYYSRMERSITHEDVLPFTGMLQSMHPIHDLDLIVHSSGGDGLAAEKLLDLCRKHCQGKIRVIVPMYAKSAATLIALGGDSILMGETSELGPIDAQLPVIQDNHPHWVSADHFLRARDSAISDLAANRPDETREAAQIQLSMLSPAFLVHCKDLMDFAVDFAGKQLRKYMFASEYASDAATWDDRINKIVQNLTASSQHLAHGRMITGEQAKSHADLMHLKIELLPVGNESWHWITDLLLRTELVVQSEKIGKILFASGGFEMVSN